MKNEIKKIGMEEIVRIVTLQSGPELALLNSVFQNLPDAKLSIERKRLSLDRLKESLSSEFTFGEIVSRYLSEKNLNPKTLAEQISLPEETIQSLTKDSILPFSVPVVLMKRFIEHLGIQFDVALKSLQLTTATLADALFEDQDFTAKAGVSARRGYEISLSGIEPKVTRNRASVLQSGERYLQRLKQLTHEG
jgi:hypothetical protein